MKTVFIKDILSFPKISETQILKGWIYRKRIHKDIAFFDLYDSTGSVQVIFYRHDYCKDSFDDLCSLNVESALTIHGFLDETKNFIATSYIIEAKATLLINPTPSNTNRNLILDCKKNSKQILMHPTFYMRDKLLAAIYFFKVMFKKNLQEYFWSKGYVEFESPTLTRQTLYDDKAAFWLDFNNQKVSLSRCATFHLESAIFAYEKVFTVTNSHANEMSRSDRHLAEYTHLKAELAWITLEELIDIAGEMLYQVSKKTIDDCQEQIKTIYTDYAKVNERLEKLNPRNFVTITYDDALLAIESAGEHLEYGKSLSTKLERILTKKYDENFVWIKFLPRNVEGFMFKRKRDNSNLTMTCDLVAPYGFGEILGTAEKTTDYNELLDSMAEKGKSKDIDRYRDYLDLHRLGLPQHGGIGMGVERAVRYILDLDHIKLTRPFAVVHGHDIYH